VGELVGVSSFVHEVMPKAPARAVSTVIRTLRMKAHLFPPSREGDTESFDEILVFIQIEI
jgi:hypothetical protein